MPKIPSLVNVADAVVEATPASKKARKSRAKPYQIEVRSEGKGKPTVEKFDTLDAASEYVQSQWQGADYADGDDGFHSDYCTFRLIGFTLRQIGQFYFTADDCREYRFVNQADMEAIKQAVENEAADAAKDALASVAAEIAMEAGPVPPCAAPVVTITEETADGAIVRTTDDILSLGYSLALADLADARGLEVADAAAMPHILKQAGLPAMFGPSIVRRAQQLYRNAIDGMLFRNNRPLNQAAPVLTRAEAEAVISSPAPTKKLAAINGTALKPGTARSNIFGFPTTRVIMWAGKNGYNAEQVGRMLAHFGCTSTPTSIATFIRSGIKGDRGEVAGLSEEQAAQIKTIIG